MQSTRIGDFEVHRVAEFEGPFLTPAEFFPDFDPEVVRANADLLGPRLIEPASGKLDLQLSYLRRQDRASHDPDQFLPRQRQGASDAAAIPSHAHVLSRRSRPRRGQARGCRLCDVHASALGPCRLEHPARQRPLGPDLPQRALRDGPPRVRALAGGAAARRGHAAPPRLRGQRAAGGADRAVGAGRRRLRARGRVVVRGRARPHARQCRDPRPLGRRDRRSLWAT